MSGLILIAAAIVALDVARQLMAAAQLPGPDGQAAGAHRRQAVSTAPAALYRPLPSPPPEAWLPATLPIPRAAACLSGPRVSGGRVAPNDWQASLPRLAGLPRSDWTPAAGWPSAPSCPDRAAEGITH